MKYTKFSNEELEKIIKDRNKLVKGTAASVGIERLALDLKEARETINNLKHVGAQFSNIAYNWGQDSIGEIKLTTHDKKTLRDLVKQWDQIKK